MARSKVSLSTAAKHLIAGLGVALVFTVSLHSCVRDRETIRPPKVEFPGIPDSPPLLLVCIAEDVEACRIECDGPVAALNDTTVLARWPQVPDSTAGASASGISIGGEQFDVHTLDIEPTGDARISVDGKRYRGSIRLDAGSDRSVNSHRAATLDVINRVRMERYLLGVVGCEMISGWPAAALEAQATAARTYALKRWLKRRERSFHLRATQADQVYKGISRETRKVTAAVEATRGAVLFYDGGPLKTYYSSCCGGRTTSASVGLGVRTITPLRGVKCGFCDPTKHVAGTGTPKSIYRWKTEVSKARLADELREREYIVDAVTSVKGVDPQAGGWLLSVEVGLKTGGPVSLKATDFRRMVGYSKVKSTSFVCKDNGASILIEGRGWGHGVGMCQWGAKGMADAGHTSTAILEHYYPGAEIKRLY